MGVFVWEYVVPFFGASSTGRAESDWEVVAMLITKRCCKTIVLLIVHGPQITLASIESESKAQTAYIHIGRCEHLSPVFSRPNWVRKNRTKSGKILD